MEFSFLIRLSACLSILLAGLRRRGIRLTLM